MGLETQKAQERRVKDGCFELYLKGKGIDIGCGTDVLKVYEGTVDPWDWEHGATDAQVMAGVADNSYDFVYSSHCLEHMRDPVAALKSWVKICKVGGYLFITVPDEDLYEQGIWPSRFNGDHKTTWTKFKPVGKSWSPVSVNIVTLPDHVPNIILLDCYRVDTHYDYALMNTHFGTKESVDQSGGNVEVGLEFILQKVG